MKFSEIVDEATALLQRRRRLSYRALKMEFDLDDDQLDAVKDELIDIQELAADKDGNMLIWLGDSQSMGTVVQPQPQSPASYTPSHLAERILAEQAAMESRGAVDGERKTITALFADLKGSTALIEGLDPEEARAIIDPALQIMMDAVHRYDGYVAQALGDGIFALFGAPIAREDHPQRALYASLRMQEEMRQYSDRSRLKGGIPLQMRVGINTGEVVVRSIRKDDLHTDYVPVGHSTNLAARMEQMATPGSILVTDYTHKLADGFFEFKGLGVAEINGVDEPLDVFEVIGAGPLRTRLQLSAERGLSRFVGRQNEMDQLRQALAQAKDGHGQLVGVMGEPGLGKSRLFHEFKLTSQSGCLLLEAFSVSHGKATPYLPVIELLKEYFEIAVEDERRKRREKITGKVLALDRGLEDTLPYFFSLLGVEDPAATLQQMDPQIRRARMVDALKRLFSRESLNQPVIVIFEDLHWIDSETQALLDMFGESIASACIVLLVNYRPEYRHEWGAKTYYTQLRLAPLGREDAEELLAFLIGKDMSLLDLKQLILERTEGTPFFMEEVAQTLAEEGVLIGERGNFRLETVPSELHISPTVQGILAARIDRLETDEKKLLQQLAVVGREFPYALVREVVVGSENELYRLLSSLQSKEFLYEQPALADVEYIFKHALTQEVAYGTVLQEQRKVLHDKTAQALEALYYSNVEDHYGELAHHYTKGGNIEKAIEYLHLAGQQATQHSANDEAIKHLAQALELLNTLEDTSVRAEQELSIQMALGTAQMVIEGFSAPEAGLAYARADELCRQLGDRPEVIDVLVGLWAFHVTGQSELTIAREIAENLLRLAQDRGDSTSLVKAHYAMLITSYLQGEFLAMRAHTEQFIGIYDKELHHKSTASTIGFDFGVLAQCYGAMMLWELGYSEQAAESRTAALALADELAHAYTSVWASTFSATFDTLRNELQAARQHADIAAKLSHEYGFTMPWAWATILHEAAMAGLGHVENQGKEAAAAIAALRGFGGELCMPYLLGAMAEIHGKAGQVADALSVLDEAIELCIRRGERWYEAELYRLKGEMTLRSSGTPPGAVVQREAEVCFERSLEIARAQIAKSWELRAATSLGRLWQQQGKQVEARDLLAPVYDWFTEGFDTKDRQDAKALLEELT